MALGQQLKVWKAHKCPAGQSLIFRGGRVGS